MVRPWVFSSFWGNLTKLLFYKSSFYFLSLFHLSTVSLTSPLFQKSSIKIFRKALLLSSPKTRSKKKKKKKCAQIENKTNGRGYYLFPELKKSQKKDFLKKYWIFVEFIFMGVQYASEIYLLCFSFTGMSQSSRMTLV